jgi:hypothetical protein
MEAKNYMKHVLLILLITASLWAHAQKTTRNTVSEFRGVTITQMITTQADGTADTLFLMMGRNAKYTQIIDIVTLKHGTARDISDLLTECMKFLPEKESTSLEYRGNTLMSLGKNQIMLFGTGQDQRGYILLNKGVITKLQTDLAGHL